MEAWYLCMLSSNYVVTLSRVSDTFTEGLKKLSRSALRVYFVLRFPFNFLMWSSSNTVKYCRGMLSIFAS